MACASGLLKLVVVWNIEKGDGPSDDNEVLDVDGHGEGQQGDDRNHGIEGAACLRGNPKCGVRVPGIRHVHYCVTAACEQGWQRLPVGRWASRA